MLHSRPVFTVYRMKCSISHLNPFYQKSYSSLLSGSTCGNLVYRILKWFDGHLLAQILVKKLFHSVSNLHNTYQEVTIHKLTKSRSKPKSSSPWNDARDDRSSVR
ncbi:uncharacterized protein LOC111805196 [Cucurbita pepo subsp. pepo]|uniref:uncharacterized protein LOC111805196 n=1 Tax=Cucurbita pepo subsp. pepo TaxID=3664 RepID=UPI000C9D4B4D|nr:uncharacterized protein LOC111805196 [Cucurbita pepo subsp. pepo]